MSQTTSKVRWTIQDVAALPDNEWIRYEILNGELFAVRSPHHKHQHVSYERLAQIQDEAGHFRGAPELVVEVLSPGKANEDRDRLAQLKLYSVQGVQEYWIVDRIAQRIEVYQRDNAQLKLVTTLLIDDVITSPLLPNFACEVARLFVSRG